MRITDKIAEIEHYLEELISIMPEDYREYLSDIKTRAACERYFEKIIESAVDLAFLVIKEERFKTPEEDKEAFDILATGKVISTELAGRLKDAKGMRNILAHQYGQVDDAIVFEAITKEVVRDVREFVNKIRIRL